MIENSTFQLFQFDMLHVMLFYMYIIVNSLTYSLHGSISTLCYCSGQPLSLLTVFV